MHVSNLQKCCFVHIPSPWIMAGGSQHLGWGTIPIDSAFGYYGFFQSFKLMDPEFFQLHQLTLTHYSVSWAMNSRTCGRMPTSHKPCGTFEAIVLWMCQQSGNHTSFPRWIALILAKGKPKIETGYSQLPLIHAAGGDVGTFSGWVFKNQVFTNRQPV